MVLPVVEVKVTADTTQATANLSTFGKQLSVIPATGKKATAAAAGFTGSLKNLGNVSNRTRSQIQNTAFQLQDIAVQLQGGTKASVALAQQLPQLAGGFGAVGAVIGVLAAVGIPALAFAFSGAGDDADALADSLETLDDISDALSGGLDLLRLDAQDLSDTYGEAADRIRQFAIAQAEINVDQASRRLSEQVSILGNLADKYRLVEGEMSLFARAESQVFDDFGVIGDDALRLSQALGALGDAVGPAMQAEGLQQVFDLLEEMDIPLSEIPEDLKLAINEMITLGAETARVEELVRQLSDTASQVSIGLEAFGGLGRQIADPEFTRPGKPTRGGGGKEASRLEALIKSLETERETIERFRTEGLERLASASEEELAAIGGINEAKLRLEQEYQDRLRGIKIKAQQTDLSMTLGAASDVLSALGAFNDKAFKLAKVAGAAQALISTFQGAAEALKLPFPANLAAAATVTAKGLALVGAIKGVSSGGGGGGAGGGSGAAAAAAPVAAQSPLNVRLSGLGAGDSITGGQLSSLFDRLQDEAGDRGLQVSFAT